MPRVLTWVTGQGGEQAEIGTRGRHGDGPRQEQSPRSRQRSRQGDQPTGSGAVGSRVRVPRQHGELSRVSLRPAPTLQSPRGSHSHQLCWGRDPSSRLPLCSPTVGLPASQAFSFFLFFFFRFGDGTKRNTSSGQYPSLARGSRAGHSAPEHRTQSETRLTSLPDRPPNGARGPRYFYHQNLAALLQGPLPGLPPAHPTGLGTRTPQNMVTTVPALPGQPAAWNHVTVPTGVWSQSLPGGGGSQDRGGAET